MLSQAARHGIRMLLSRIEFYCPVSSRHSWHHISLQKRETKAQKDSDGKSSKKSTQGLGLLINKLFEALPPFFNEGLLKDPLISSKRELPLQGFPRQWWYYNLQADAK